MGRKLLEVNNITKSYHPKGRPIIEALKGVSFDIVQGEILGLLGVNGAGKSTLSSILCTLHPQTSGHIYWNDVSIHDNLLAYRRIFGYCPQHPNLDKELTLGESLVFAGRCYGMSRDEAQMRAEEVMTEFQLGRYAQSSPDELSGGYRQRFLIARTVMHRPQFVVLDEPTVGLDPHVRHALWETIRELKKQGTTVLLTTHYLDEAEVLSDRVCFIHGGEIKLIDTPKALLEKYKKTRLEEVFLEFVDDNSVEIFKTEDANAE
ncbi:MAG: ABC transporter ATP-binding protein [Simkaniaceae bacterium]|nr:ABC transporter ATP-binding protein [Simkaniaceae bacterium]